MGGLGTREYSFSWFSRDPYKGHEEGLFQVPVAVDKRAGSGEYLIQRIRYRGFAQSKEATDDP